VILLEYLEGNGGVLDGNNDPTVVKVQDVMLLLKNLKSNIQMLGSELNRNDITNVIIYYYQYKSLKAKH